MFRDFDITEFLVRFPALILALSVHEFAHGLAAYKLGDSTAKYDGRLSLNPLRHIDPIGLICLLFFRFGWAKPVMVNSSYFSNPKRGMALTAFAGPFSNFILAFVALLIFYPVYLFFPFENIAWLVSSFFLELVFLSLSLGFFNMIPFPPLDGSKILGAILPNRIYYFILKYERFGFLILMVLVWNGGFSYILEPLVNITFNGMLFLVQKIYFFI